MRIQAGRGTARSQGSQCSVPKAFRRKDRTSNSLLDSCCPVAWDITSPAFPKRFRTFKTILRSLLRPLKLEGRVGIEEVKNGEPVCSIATNKRQYATSRRHLTAQKEDACISRQSHRMQRFFARFLPCLRRTAKFNCEYRFLGQEVSG